MQIIIGVLLLCTFLGMIIYSLKGGNLMLGILVMAILWTFLPLLGNRLVTDPAFIEANQELIETPIMTALTKIFQTSPENWGKVLVTFIFGAWFGRVMLDTGIASSIIRKTVELGGDKPGLTAMLLYIVTAAIFSSMFGAGAVVAIGIIVLPILLSLGVPKILALVSFMFSVGAGFYINPVGFAQYQEPTVVPGSALITPFLPLILTSGCKMPILLSFLLSSFYAMFTCKRMRTYQSTVNMFARTFFDGVVDTAPLVGISALIPMFNAASSFCVPYFQAIQGNIVPASTLLICIVFMFAAPLGLFRGPLTLAGAGTATLGILKGLGFTNMFLFPLMYAPTVTMNISSCITQSWIVWGISYTKVSGRDYLKKTIPAGWLVCVILAAVTYMMFGR